MSNTKFPHVCKLTTFVDRIGRRLKVHEMPLVDVVKMITEESAASKKDLPLLKLALFGDQKSEAGCLRTNKNTTAITGVELDYDKEQIPFEVAVEAISRAGVMAIPYTSPSYTLEKPRWRILAFLSKAYYGNWKERDKQRKAFVDQLIGVLGLGPIFGEESYVLSQAHYYGFKVGNKDHKVELVEGEYLDLLKNEFERFGDSAKFDMADAVDGILKGEDLHDSTLKLAMSLIARGKSETEAIDHIQALMERSDAPRDSRFEDRFNDISRLVQSAKTKCESDEDARAVADLAKLPPMEYDRRRDTAASELHIRVSTLDKMVDKARGEQAALDDDGQGTATFFPEVEAWPEAVDGAQMLDDLACAIRSHVVMADAPRDAIALWTVHTWLIEQFGVSPRAAITSPVKQCGKTTLLDVLSFLVRRSLPSANLTAALVFRTVEAFKPTLLIDEADTFLRSNDELRGILNSGHRRTGRAMRLVGDEHEPKAFSTYSACAIAMIGKLPDTLADRSLEVSLKRRLAGEPIVPIRLDCAPHLEELSRKIARWAADHAVEISDSDPQMPEGVFNRRADNWRPLLAIAEAAGGDWPRRAREAASGTQVEDEGQTEQLLADIRDIFGDRDRLPSFTLADDLANLEGRPWAEYGYARKPITPDQLAKLLKPLGVAPTLMKFGDKPLRGYSRFLFDDALSRYTPLSGCYPVTNPITTATSDVFEGVTGSPKVTPSKSQKPNNHRVSNTVTPSEGGSSAREGLNGGNPRPRKRRADWRQRPATHPADHFIQFGRAAKAWAKSCDH